MKISVISLGDSHGHCKYCDLLLAFTRGGNDTFQLEVSEEKGIIFFHFQICQPPPPSMKIPCHCWSWRWARKGSDPRICQHREVLLRSVPSLAIMGGGECSEKQAPAVGKPEIFTGPAPSSLQPWWVTKRPFSGRPNINSSGLSWEQDVCLLLKLQTWQSAQAYNCN